MTDDQRRVYNLLRDEVAGEVGFRIERGCGRVYGVCDDYIIELCASFIVDRLGKNIGALL